MPNGWEHDYKLAIGHLNISPTEFWNMSPYEFNLALEGYNEKQKIEWRKVALILNTMGKSLKREVTVNDLLGIKKQANTIDKQEKENILNELNKQFEEG